jgi:hypothetical protein
MFLFLFIAFCFCAGVVLLASELRNAPVGIEDRTGFRRTPEKLGTRKTNPRGSAVVRKSSSSAPVEPHGWAAKGAFAQR